MKIEPFTPYPWDENIRLEMMGKNKLIDISPVENTSVVLGRVTPDHPDVNRNACDEDGIPIYRRKGGGGCVLLFPGVLVVTAVYQKDNELVDLEDFLNRMVCLIKRGVKRSTGLTDQIDSRGMGDLCIGNRKILGSSIYSTRGFIGYYGSLIVGGDYSLIEKYLGPPSKEPDYRKGRAHKNFVTSIEACCDKIEEEVLINSIKKELDGFSLDLLKNQDR